MTRLQLLLLLAPALAGCDMVGCGNKVLQVVVAPDGRHRAFVYRRDCGATTGFSTQVSVEAGASSLPGEPDPVLVLGDEPVFVTWSGPDRLLISYRRGARPTAQESRRDGVRISYRAL
jgi:hypothetical protein